MRWIEKLYVENILIENVKEFVEWGPLTARACPTSVTRANTSSSSSRRFSINYNVEYRVLNCADYGDPTTRGRFFLIARRGHKKIVWPERTHASRKELAKIAAQPDLFPDGKTLLPWVPARQIIDWKLEGKSIFGRKKPLSPNTMRRIFAGLEKYGLKKFMVNLKNARTVAIALSTNRHSRKPLAGIIRLCASRSLSRNSRRPTAAISTSHVRH
jgi:DNA (cytosine-5)-methyltransferase 1